LRGGDVNVLNEKSGKILGWHRDDKLKMKMKDEWCTRVWMRCDDQVDCDYEPCDFVNYRFIYVGRSIEREGGSLVGLVRGGCEGMLTQCELG